MISPVLANIYRHYALDLWVEKVLPGKLGGAKVYMRYADDFIVGFEQAEDAQRFYQDLPERLAKFGLEMAKDKSGIRRFRRPDLKGSVPFTFLGFEFYWARTRRGYRTVQRRTSKKKFRDSLRNLKEWLQRQRGRALREIVERLRRKYRGYWNYYGVRGNSPALGRYWYESQRLIFAWLNRRSQRRSYTWSGFNEMWKKMALPRPRIVAGPYRPESQSRFSYT